MAGFVARIQSQERKNKAKILIFDGDLSEGLHYQESPDALLFGTDRIHGATHQFGRPEANIPKREFLGISENDKQDILDITLQYLESEIQGQ